MLDYGEQLDKIFKSLKWVIFIQYVLISLFAWPAIFMVDNIYIRLIIILLFTFYNLIFFLMLKCLICI
jgi:hypothetical protein